MPMSMLIPMLMLMLMQCCLRCRTDCIGTLDYRGYIRPKKSSMRRSSGDPNRDHLVTIQFQWNGLIKPVSSSLVGTSPEFEMALYTLCFFMGSEAESVVSLGE